MANAPAPPASAPSVPAASEDFYLHVNKTWLDDPNNAIPDEYSQWGGFVKLHDDGLKKQIAMVKALKGKADATEEERKISAIWEAWLALHGTVVEGDMRRRQGSGADQVLAPAKDVSGTDDTLDRIAGCCTTGNCAGW